MEDKWHSPTYLSKPYPFPLPPGDATRCKTTHRRAHSPATRPAERGNETGNEIRLIAQGAECPHTESQQLLHASETSTNTLPEESKWQKPQEKLPYKRPWSAPMDYLRERGKKNGRYLAAPSVRTAKERVATPAQTIAAPATTAQPNPMGCNGSFEFFVLFCFAIFCGFCSVSPHGCER